MDSERVLEAALYVRGGVPERARLDFALRIGPGLTLVRGPSGAGKTTLLMALAGLLRPDAGRIQLGPRIFFDAQRKVCVPARERRVGLVFQSLSLFPHLSVIENVAFGIRGADRDARALSWLARMRVAHLERRAIASLSGGEAQRVALARAGERPRTAVAGRTILGARSQIAPRAQVRSRPTRAFVAHTGAAGHAPR